MDRNEVTVVGSIMMDLVTYTDTLPKLGETIFGNSFQKSFGGKGANQAVQCARLGVKIKMIGCIGNDSYGNEYLEQFDSEGVDRVNIKKSNNTLSSGIASIQVDKNGQNSIIIIQGANLDFNAEYIYENESVIKNSNVIVCQNEIPFETTYAALNLCKLHKTLSILNPAPVSDEVINLIPLCDIICPNEVELASLTKLPIANTDEEISIATRKLLSMGCNIVVVTLGARGACLAMNDTIQFFKADTVNAIDTVGAGDSFIGTFASNLSRNVPIELAIERAIYCASLSVTKKGAQISYPHLNDIQDIYYHPMNNSKTDIEYTTNNNDIIDKNIIRSSYIAI